jgi:Na+-translocating ferredoxin:NAD+ oxidoreductase subunit E
MKWMKELTKGIYVENPVFRIVLGLCPTLAVSVNLENALGMGVAATFVLLGSNILISMMRKFTPDKIRIPIFVVFIASFVTIVEMMMSAFTRSLYHSLGIFIPLIVVNCIILGRAEAFAKKNTVFASILDAIGMGIGFTLALIVISFFRELIGTGGWNLLNFHFPESVEPALVFILPPGAFITIAMLMALQAKMDQKKADKVLLAKGHNLESVNRIMGQIAPINVKPILTSVTTVEGTVPVDQSVEEKE